MMTTDKLNQAVKDWLIDSIHPESLLIDLPVLINGDDGTLDAPFIGVMETASETVVQGGVVLHGVHEVSLSVTLSTIPLDDADGGTSPGDHREMAGDLWEILADRSILSMPIDGLRLFDFRAANPTTEAADGRRITTIQLTAIACPI
jgi:hypothetical protein